MFLRIETSVSTMLAQQNLATMRALNAAFGDSRASAPAPAQPNRAVVANAASAVTSVALRQQVAAAADAAANAANANGGGQTESPSGQQLQMNSTSAALSEANAAYAEVIDALNQ
jgi:hypothetical protein